MFNRIDIPHIDRKLTLLDRDDGHWYKNEFDEIIPSVTTVRNLVTPKDWHKYWVYSLMKKYEISKEDATIKADLISSSSMEVGTAMHQLLEDYCNDPNYITVYTKTFEKEPYELYAAVKPVLDKSVTNVYATEYKMYSKKLGLAGTVDMICDFDGVKSVVDYKNSRSYKSLGDVVKHGYCDQLCAYGTMWNETFDDDIKQGIIIVASWDDRARVFKVDLEQYMNPLLNTINKYNEMLWSGEINV